jgi:hypothetical protein
LWIALAIVATPVALAFVIVSWINEPRLASGMDLGTLGAIAFVGGYVAACSRVPFQNRSSSVTRVTPAVANSLRRATRPSCPEGAPTQDVSSEIQVAQQPNVGPPPSRLRVVVIVSDRHQDNRQRAMHWTAMKSLTEHRFSGGGE